MHLNCLAVDGQDVTAPFVKSHNLNKFFTTIMENRK